jgi:hypothetical protein
MSARSNGRIEEVLTTTRFDSAERLAQTIERYVQIYHQHIPQKARGHIAPIQALKNWHDTPPNSSKNVSIISRDLTTITLSFN